MKAAQESETCPDGGGYFTYAPSTGRCRCCSEKDNATTSLKSSSSYNVYETLINTVSSGTGTDGGTGSGSAVEETNGGSTGGSTAGGTGSPGTNGSASTSSTAGASGGSGAAGGSSSSSNSPTPANTIQAGENCNEE